MKKIQLLFLSAMPLLSMAQTEKPFEVNGSVKNIALPAQKVFIYYQSNGNRVTDSTPIINNTYSFKGKVNEPIQATLVIKYAPGADGKPTRTVGKRDQVALFLSGDRINVHSVDSFANAKITGSRANEEFAKLTASLKPINDELTLLYADYNKANSAKDEAAKKAIEDKIDALQPSVKNVYGEYAKKNPSSPIALYAVNQYAGWDIDPELVAPVFAALPENVRSGGTGKFLSDRIDIARKTAIGQPALDFTQNDTLGNPVSLSSMKGKYVLVDFWASWCGPCRRENPNVVKAYNQYKGKGFAIVGVSLDQPGAKDKWIEAIHKDNLTWTHVSDLKYWDNDVAKQYGVRAIPQNFLVDPDGKIVAKNLNGETLDKKLSELLPK